jgi:hypothetical protein
VSIEVFPKGLPTPSQMLADSSNRLDDMRGIIIIEVHKDGTYRSGWSNMMTSDLAAAALLFHGEAERRMREGG